MKVAVSDWIYAGEPLPVTFERLARLGCDGVELVGEPSRDDPIQVRQLGREYGLRVSSILGWRICGIPGNHRLRDLLAEEGLRYLKSMEAALGI